MPRSLKDYKDKKLARKYRNRVRRKNYRKGGYTRKKGEYAPHWKPEEDEIMEMMKDQGKTDREIAEVLERPVQGIQMRRTRLKIKKEKNVTE